MRLFLCHDECHLYTNLLFFFKIAITRQKFSCFIVAYNVALHNWLWLSKIIKIRNRSFLLSPLLLIPAAAGGGRLPPSSPSLNIVMASKFSAHTPRMKAFFIVSSYRSLSAWRWAISFRAISSSRVA